MPGSLEDFYVAESLGGTLNKEGFKKKCSLPPDLGEKIKQVVRLTCVYKNYCLETEQYRAR